MTGPDAGLADEKLPIRMLHDRVLVGDRGAAGGVATLPADTLPADVDAGRHRWGRQRAHRA